MKIALFDVRPQEKAYLSHWADELDLDLDIHDESLSLENLDAVTAADAVSILSSTIDGELAAALVEKDVPFLSTRSIGYDTVDVAAANEAGLRVAHSAYDPNAVAEFTVMLLLMTIRKAQQMLRRAAVQDYSLEGQMGRQLSEMTVGIIGAGRIGSKVAQLLSSFGCRILASDPVHNPALEGIVEFVDQATLLEQSDAVTLHVPAWPENHRMIDTPQFEQMRDGAVFINAARGDLVNHEALIAAIESGKIGGAALDAMVDDLSYYHKDNRLTLLTRHELALLAWYPNVILTPHMAFYTDTVMSQMIGNALKALRDFVVSGETELEVHA